MARDYGFLEALMLRIKDVDFERGQLTVRDPEVKARPDDNVAASRNNVLAHHT
jgi:hypothetical protein